MYLSMKFNGGRAFVSIWHKNCINCDCLYSISLAQSCNYILYTENGSGYIKVKTIFREIKLYSLFWV